MDRFDTAEKEVLLATALAAGSTAASAARELDIGLSTVKRRMAEQQFQQLVADLRAEMVAAALGRMADNMTRAADQIAALMNDENPSVRLRASRALISLGLKMHQAVDVDQRLRSLQVEVAQFIQANP
jgi:transposase-like protein